MIQTWKGVHYPEACVGNQAEIPFVILIVVNYTSKESREALTQCQQYQVRMLHCRTSRVTSLVWPTQTVHVDTMINILDYYNIFHCSSSETENNQAVALVTWAWCTSLQVSFSVVSALIYNVMKKYFRIFQCTYSIFSLLQEVGNKTDANLFTTRIK